MHAGLPTFLVPKLKDITEEEFNLCVQQWNSMPNWVQILVEEGKCMEPMKLTTVTILLTSSVNITSRMMIDTHKV